MIHMIIRKARHREIAVIISILPPQIDFPLALGRFHEVLGEELVLVVEIITGTLICRIQLVDEVFMRGWMECTTSIKMSSGAPVHFFTSSVESCSAHFDLSSPK